MGAWGFECSSHPGGLHILEPFFYAELVDMDSGEPITEPGRYGKLILTNLYRRGRPCIRFDTKDIACWSENRCECGRTFRMLRGGVQGRADHLLKVRGTFFNPATVENIIAKDENCSHEYRIYLGKDNYSVSLVAEAAKNVPESRFPEMEKELQRKISTAIFMRLNVEVLPFGSLERGDAKTKRIIDLREKRA